MIFPLFLFFSYLPNLTEPNRAWLLKSDKIGYAHGPTAVIPVHLKK